MKSTESGTGVLEAYCERHLPVSGLYCSVSEHNLTCRQESQAAVRKAHLETGGVNAGASAGAKDARAAKSARAYAKAYAAGPPLVPAVVVRRIVAYVAALTVRKKDVFVRQVARYWSLKREARRGAPLLKRLHLEPWTAAAAAKDVTEEERAMKIQVRASEERAACESY
jgi:hypothetical protein